MPAAQQPWPVYIATIEQPEWVIVHALRHSGLGRRRLDFGPGYRLYFGRDGERLIILLAGGTKSRQQRDIETARQ